MWACECGLAFTSAGAARMKRDQEDIGRFVSSFNSGLLTNPFDVSEDRDKSEKLPYLNITTGVVLPEQASDRLLDTTEMGRRSMEDFISSRINTNEVNFRDPLPRLKINTLSSAAKKMEVKAGNDKIVTLTTD